MNTSKSSNAKQILCVFLNREHNLLTFSLPEGERLPSSVPASFIKQKGAKCILENGRQSIVWLRHYYPSAIFFQEYPYLERAK